jgi:hypothetical protein
MVLSILWLSVTKAHEQQSGCHTVTSFITGEQVLAAVCGNLYDLNPLYLAPGQAKESGEKPTSQGGGKVAKQRRFLSEVAGFIKELNQVGW